MSVQGCGDDVLALFTLVFVLRLTRSHTPVQSYLSAPLRFGRDDGLRFSAKLPTVISSEAEKYERPGVWGQFPRKPSVRDRIADNSFPHAPTVVSLHSATVAMTITTQRKTPIRHSLEKGNPSGIGIVARLGMKAGLDPRVRGDDDWAVCALPPTVISSEAEKHERPGVWERCPRPLHAGVRIALNSFPHAATVVSLRSAALRSR